MSQTDLSVSCVYELQVVRKEPYLFDGWAFVLKLRMLLKV